MDHTPHALDYLSVVRRRRWWLVVPIVAALAVGVALLQYLPKEYRATVTLGVAAPTVSPTLVNQSAALDNQERLRALSQQLLSDPVLSRVVAEQGGGTGDPGRVNALRSAVKITVPEPVARTDESRRLDAFMVAYTDSDPGRAQQTANTLATVFIDEHSKTRSASAGNTSAFLIAERDRAEQRLAQLEARLRQAKEGFIGRLPEQTQGNLAALAGLRQQLELNATSRRHQQDRVAMIQRQIETMEQDASKGITVAGGLGLATGPDRVSEIERELSAARATYTQKHPEVQRLEAELQTALREVVAPAPRPSVDRQARLQIDPMYRQLLADRETTRLAIRDLDNVAASVRAQMGDYQRRVDSAPMVEQHLASVQREYDLAQQQYTELSSKVQTAAMAEQLARNGNGEQFFVIYPAGFPAKPVSPVPARVMLIALLIGLCLGGAAALTREYLDRSVHSVSDLADELELPVLGAVAHVPAS
jgi:polysaccharide chain length determinant protein (PEP-CTERM system associated)